MSRWCPPFRATIHDEGNLRYHIPPRRQPAEATMAKTLPQGSTFSGTDFWVSLLKNQKYVQQPHKYNVLWSRQVSELYLWGPSRIQRTHLTRQCLVVNDEASKKRSNRDTPLHINMDPQNHWFVEEHDRLLWVNSQVPCWFAGGYCSRNMAD